MQSGPAPQTSTSPTNSMALVSLIAGIVGLTVFPVLGSIVAIITGNMAKKEIAASAGAQGGEGLAKAGVILGWVGVGLGVLGVCAFCAAFLVPFVMAGVIDTTSLLIPLALLV